MTTHVYKNLYIDDEGNYIFATDEDTRQVVSQESYLLAYILEVLLSSSKKKKKEK